MQLVNGGVYPYDAFRILGFELDEETMERYQAKMAVSIETERLGAMDEKDMNMLTEAAGRITRASTLDPKAFQLAASILGITLPPDALVLLEELMEDDQNKPIPPRFGNNPNQFGGGDDAPPNDQDEMRAELVQWHRRSMKAAKLGKQLDAPFGCDKIPTPLYNSIMVQLKAARSVDDVNTVFDGVFAQMRGAPADLASALFAAVDALRTYDLP